MFTIWTYKFTNDVSKGWSDRLFIRKNNVVMDGNWNACLIIIKDEPIGWGNNFALTPFIKDSFGDDKIYPRYPMSNYPMSNPYQDCFRRG